MSEKSVDEIVAEAKAPGKFNILSVLKERAYPTEDVDIYLDEDIAFLASQVDVEINLLNSQMDSNVDNSEAVNELLEKRDGLIAKRDEMVERLGGNKYIFTITGISEGRREDLYNIASEKFPVENTTKSNPFTGQQEKEEVENRDRNRLFTNLLWAAHIKQITSPDGSIQDGITLEDAIELRRNLPIAASGKITESIEKIRAATAVFMITVDEDFLAKS